MPMKTLKDEANLTPEEMLDELIRSGHVVPIDEDSQPVMPSAYKNVPSITTSHSVPGDIINNEGG